MAFHNPKGRANYEPNSWGGAAGGPRETPEKGFRSYPEHISGEKRRLRAESFADHYSQARQFYVSQTKSEQDHIASAFTFELSKVETPAIRARVVSHLLNVDTDLANTVAAELRLEEMPSPANAAQPTMNDLASSPALSIVMNGPKSLKGRKIGLLVSDGVSMDLVKGLKAAVKAEGALLEVVAPMVGGVNADDGSLIEGDQKVDGGPSVLYDAVAVLLSAEGASTLAKNPTAKDFVTDAFAHCKFVAYNEAALTLFEKAGIAADMDGGFIKIAKAGDAERFIDAARDLRFWSRETMLK